MDLEYLKINFTSWINKLVKYVSTSDGNFDIPNHLFEISEVFVFFHSCWSRSAPSVYCLLLSLETAVDFVAEQSTSHFMPTSHILCDLQPGLSMCLNVFTSGDMEMWTALWGQRSHHIPKKNIVTADILIYFFFYWLWF